jgi:hypothetical protein
MNVGLLEKQMICPLCTEPMKRNGLRWRCGKNRCKKKEITVRSNSFFEKSKVPIRKLVRLLYIWCDRDPVTKAAENLKISQPTAVDWFQFCRDVCSV